MGRFVVRRLNRAITTMLEFGQQFCRIVHAPAGIVVAISVAALAFLLALGGGQDRGVHDSVLLSLRAIDINSASLQRDVLRARVGLLDDYTLLEKSADNLRSAFQRLEALTQKGLGSLEARTELSELSAAIARDETLAKRFKSLNPTLQHSLTHFGETELAIRESSVELDCRSQIGDLTDRMHRFSASPTPVAREEFRRALDSLDSSLCEIGGKEQLRRDGVVLLSTIPVVDRVAADLQNTPTLFYAERVQEEYLSLYGIVSARAYWARVGLLSVAIFLCGYISLLAFKLRRQTSRLERRLWLETVLREMEADFDAVKGLHSVGSAVTSSLDRLGRFLDAAVWQCEIIDVETGSTSAHYGEPEARAKTISPPARGQFLARLAANGAATLKREPYRQILQMHDAYRLGSGNSAFGMALGILTRNDDAAFYAIAFARPRLALAAEETDLALTGLNAVFDLASACVEREERIRLEQMLEHGERLQAVGRLAGGIAHEFNNILGAIRGYGEMVLSRLRPGSKTHQYVGQIEKTAKRGQNIVDQILTLSRRRQSATMPFEAIEAVTESVASVRAALPKTFSVSSELKVGRAIIDGNPFEFQQMLVNLCRNAYQARIGDGAVVLKAELQQLGESRIVSQGKLTPGTYLRIEITDDGAGINQSILPHIFEPFFTTRSGEGGTGLGLATVMGTVAGMSGGIEVESELGRGTTFTLFFPVIDAAPTPLSEFPHPGSTVKGKGETVAIIHTDSEQLAMYEENVAALGYEPFGFRSVASMQKWLERTRKHLDALLFDGELDEHAAVSMKAIGAATPIVLVTEHGPRAEMQGPLRPAAILVRPVRPNSLSEVLSTVMNQ